MLNFLLYKNQTTLIDFNYMFIIPYYFTSDLLSNDASHFEAILFIYYFINRRILEIFNNFDVPKNLDINLIFKMKGKRL